jgi:hypothetical protein
MLEKLTAQTFGSHIGSVYRVVLREGALELTLDAVETRSGGSPDRRLQFSLIFIGPPGVHLPQQIYALEHAVLGSLELFLVPLGPEPRGQRYEAAFA